MSKIKGWKKVKENSKQVTYKSTKTKRVIDLNKGKSRGNIWWTFDVSWADGFSRKIFETYPNLKLAKKRAINWMKKNQKG